MKQKKNNTNQSVTWPKDALFTFEDLHQLNPDIISITLRVKMTKAIEEGRIAEIGSIPSGKGRPPKVYSMTPVIQLTLDQAKAKSINLVDNAEKLLQIRPVSNMNAVSVGNASVSVMNKII
ncbi:MAG TPA: hypothetical protein PLC59_00230 [Bacteroidales bacterium]|jgi:hypothetical protein|nr:hypothetical protein [Bacteroidales bacterium]HQI44490.1 hypothetical protein [Bacteroidales bacterium]